jgi:hypothetical protein
MAENLLKYGFKTDRGRSVEDIIGEAENLISSLSSTDHGIKDFIDELLAIKKEVEERERQFYISMGVSDFAELNRKIEKIETDYAVLLPNGRAIQNIKQHIDFASISDSSTPEEIKEALALCLQEFMEEEGGREELLLAKL